MAVIPPWISVQPTDFLNAAQAGARQGAQLADTRTQAGIARDRLASSERENAMRIAAEQASVAARLSAAQRQAEAENALRQWETNQRIQMGQGELDLKREGQQQDYDLELGKIDLGKERIGAMDRQRESRERTAADRALSPVYRNVENQLVQVDPKTGQSKVLHTAPFRPRNESALDRLLNESAPVPTERVRVKSPDGKIGTIPSSQLKEALAEGYTQVQ